MPHRPPSRALVLALALALATVGQATFPGPAPADVILETPYLPTSTIVGVSPTLLPTAYVVPTSLSTTYLPTSYVATSAVIASDSVVYPTTTTILRRSVFRPRRYVARSYYSYPTTGYVSPTSYLSTSSLMPTSYIASSSLMPTSYIASSSLMPTSYIASSSLMPTVYLAGSTITPTSYVIDRGVVTTSGMTSEPCETSPMPTRATLARPSNASQGDPGNTITSSPSNAGAAPERRPQGLINNGMGSNEGATSPVKSSEVPEPAEVPKAKPNSPPDPPLPEPEPSNINLPDPGKSGKPTAGPGETSFRSVRRPSSYDGRNILRGRVISAESRRPEEGVTVLIANVTRNYADRQAMSDADGEFKVSLPDGDWQVKVKMPSGSIYPVGRDFVTASSGRVTDPSGRNVAEFLISR